MVTALLLVVMIETVLLPELVTKTLLPSGVIATPTGPTPTFNVALTEGAPERLMTLTVPGKAVLFAT